MSTAHLGLGTYRVPATALPDAAQRAADGGQTAWIDTAPNYLGGRAQTLLAPVLAAHSVPVSTKVGFIPSGSARQAVAERALSREQAAAGHCLSSEYVLWQCARNRAELGRERVDTVFVHNPERSADDVHKALLDAFMALEEEATCGRLDSYGVAVWDGFDTGALSVPHLDELARQAAGTREHHLGAVQLPVSLVTATAFRQALDGRGAIAQAADRDWAVFASAPLFGGELPHLVTPELTDALRPGLDSAQACLLATASCPGVTRVLLSASDTTHWGAARAALQQPPVSVSTLRKVLDVLATD